jgi:hypothetical protein
MARHYLILQNKDALFVSKSQQYQERFGESRYGRKSNILILTYLEGEIYNNSAEFQDQS